MTKAVKSDVPPVSGSTGTTGKGSTGEDTKRKNKPSSMRVDKQDAAGDPLMISIPNRISVGKSTLPNQQLFILVGVFAVLFHFALHMETMIEIDGSGNHQRILTSMPKRSAERRKRTRKYILDAIQDVLTKDPNAFGKRIPGINDTGEDDEPCGIYLSDSSIPESGFGWFAGRSYTEGEVIRREHENLLNVPLSVFGSSSEISPNNINFQVSGTIAASRLLLKPHSILSNVRWQEADGTSGDLSVSVLVATRTIKEGEEFFLSWDDHPFTPSKEATSDSNGSHSAFNDIFANSLPTLKHYEQADEHIREARIQYFGAINYTKVEIDKTKEKEPLYRTSNARWNRAKRKSHRDRITSELLFNPESIKEIETGLKLWRSTVNAFDPLVAKLLPKNTRALTWYHRSAEQDQSLFSSSSLLGSLRNYTVESIADTAHCVTSVDWQLVSRSESTGETETEEDLKTAKISQTTSQSQAILSSRSSYHQVVTRKRGFTKGDVVGAVPLLIQKFSQAQEPSSVTIAGNLDCLLITSSSSSSDFAICPLSGINARTNDLSIANVEYRWSNVTMNKIPNELKSLFTSSQISFSVEEEQQKESLVKEHSLSLLWDIVALRDLHENETVVLYQPEDKMVHVSSTREADTSEYTMH